MHTVQTPAIPAIQPLPWPGAMSPLDVMTQIWPVNRPLMMLHSGRTHRRWARWSILSTPIVTYRFDGRSQWLGAPPPKLAGVCFSHDPLADLDAILAATRIERSELSDTQKETTVPFRGGWIGFFSYDLGRLIEPKAQQREGDGALSDRDWPLIELAYCPAAAMFDHVAAQWIAIGDLRFEIDDHRNSESTLPIQNPKSHSFALGPFEPQLQPDQYMSKVERTIEYIAAGDIFQANIAQRFCAAFAGSTRQLCRAAMERSLPWYGAYLECTDSCVISLSPELFLHSNPCTRRIITRPIKGTRPSSIDSQQLIDSSKDAAELHMIIDLMRNDLGRVCEYGSVHVSNPRSIETHPTVHHGVGEVTGRLRDDLTFSDLLRATFPGGSVTGAPRIRAMQIIDELEPVRRGPYCGALGFISNCGAVGLNVAIRTMLLNGRRNANRFDQLDGTLDFSAGAGIVAESDPLSEYRETLDKFAVASVAQS